jgi:hypothetical protein
MISMARSFWSRLTNPATRYQQLVGVHGYSTVPDVNVYEHGHAEMADVEGECLT